MTSHSSLLLAAIVLACAPWTTGQAQKATPYSGIFVFGDSLSDSGNVFESTHGVATAPYDPVPALPYAIGGHHFSNGATWIERVADDLKLAQAAMPALRERGLFGNYAFGGARARMRIAQVPRQGRRSD